MAVGTILIASLLFAQKAKLPAPPRNLLSELGSPTSFGRDWAEYQTKQPVEKVRKELLKEGYTQISNPTPNVLRLTKPGVVIYVWGLHAKKAKAVQTADLMVYTGKMAMRMRSQTVK